MSSVTCPPEYCTRTHYQSTQGPVDFHTKSLDSNFNSITSTGPDPRWRLTHVSSTAHAPDHDSFTPYSGHTSLDRNPQLLTQARMPRTTSTITFQTVRGSFSQETHFSVFGSSSSQKMHGIAAPSHEHAGRPSSNQWCYSHPLSAHHLKRSTTYNLGPLAIFLESFSSA